MEEKTEQVNSSTEVSESKKLKDSVLNKEIFLKKWKHFVIFIIICIIGYIVLIILVQRVSNVERFPKIDNSLPVQATPTPKITEKAPIPTLTIPDPELSVDHLDEYSITWSPDKTYGLFFKKDPIKKDGNADYYMYTILYKPDTQSPFKLMHKGIASYAFGGSIYGSRLSHIDISPDSNYFIFSQFDNWSNSIPNYLYNRNGNIISSLGFESSTKMYFTADSKHIIHPGFNSDENPNNNPDDHLNIYSYDIDRKINELFFTQENENEFFSINGLEMSPDRKKIAYWHSYGNPPGLKVVEISTKNVQFFPGKAEPEWISDFEIRAYTLLLNEEETPWGPPLSEETTVIKVN